MGVERNVGSTFFYLPSNVVNPYDFRPMQFMRIRDVLDYLIMHPNHPTESAAITAFQTEIAKIRFHQKTSKKVATKAISSISDSVSPSNAYVAVEITSPATNAYRPVNRTQSMFIVTGADGNNNKRGRRQSNTDASTRKGKSASGLKRSDLSLDLRWMKGSREFPIHSSKVGPEYQATMLPPAGTFDRETGGSSDLYVSRHA
jgi:hypothetical protein